MAPRDEFAALCCLYCGVCRLQQATREDDLTTLGRLARIYARWLPELAPLTAEDLLCDGCLSERRSKFCRQCAIRECVLDRRHAGCHECADFPCEMIDRFPIPVGRQVILRAVPFRQVHGTRAWMMAEEERYRCPDCGTALFRGATRCSGCGTELNLD